MEMRMPMGTASMSMGDEGLKVASTPLGNGITDNRIATAFRIAKALLDSNYLNTVIVKDFVAAVEEIAKAL